MKNTPSRLLLLLIAFIGLSLSFPQVAGATKPGIYKTVKELNSGSPSLPLNYTTFEKKIRCGVYGLGHKYVTFNRIKLTHGQAVNLGKVVAFSDGNDTYVKVNAFKMHRISNFAKTETIGNFLYYQDVAYGSSHGGKGGGLVWWVYPVQMLYNGYTGKRMELNGPNLKKIIADKPELLNSFKNEKHKGAVLKDYLIRYYQN